MNDRDDRKRLERAVDEGRDRVERTAEDVADRLARAWQSVRGRVRDGEETAGEPAGEAVFDDTELSAEELFSRQRNS